MVSVTFDEPGDVPFWPEGAPVAASVDAELVPDWGMDLQYVWAYTVPNGVIEGTGDGESLTLISYRSTNLRVTEFPLVQLACTTFAPVQLSEGQATTTV